MTEKMNPLSVEELGAIAGGEKSEDSGTASPPPCPQCGSLSVELIVFHDKPQWRCYDCGYQWDFN